jgi:hypothetical protein
MGSILDVDAIDMLSNDRLKPTPGKAAKCHPWRSYGQPYAVFLEAWAYVNTSDDGEKTP